MTQLWEVFVRSVLLFSYMANSTDLNSFSVAFHMSSVRDTHQRSGI